MQCWTILLYYAPIKQRQSASIHPTLNNRLFYHLFKINLVTQLNIFNLIFIAIIDNIPSPSKCFSTMNKKLLICGAIAAGLFLTACSKKENASESHDQQAQSEQSNQPASEQFHSLTPTEQSAPVAEPAKVEVEHQETNNTTTTIRRHVRDVPPPAEDHDNMDAPPRHEAPAPAEKDPTPTKQKHDVSEPKNETASATNSTKASNTDSPKKASSAKLSEDDAVAAAIAAATPALKN